MSTRRTMLSVMPLAALAQGAALAADKSARPATVSYTHLTLPTSDLV